MFGPLLCNDRPMETDSYWRTQCVGEAMDPGYTFLRLPCNCGRITDFPFPRSSAAEASAGAPSSVASVFAARSAEARRRSSGSIPKGMPRAISNDAADPVRQRPRPRRKPGSRKGGVGAGERRECRLAYEQFLDSRRVPRWFFPLDSAGRFA